MTHEINTALLWFSAIGCGLLAGLYFSFSTFIMRALGRIEAPAGIAAMNSINSVILRSPFMPLFLGSSLAALILAAIALFQWHQPGSVAAFTGGAIYVVGMFVCTMAFNVPLNNALAAVDPASANGANMWHVTCGTGRSGTTSAPSPPPWQWSCSSTRFLSGDRKAASSADMQQTPTRRNKPCKRPMQPTYLGKIQLLLSSKSGLTL